MEDYRHIYNNVMQELLMKMNFIAKSLDTVDEFLRDNIEESKENLDKEKQEFLENYETQHKTLSKRKELLRTIDSIMDDFENCSVCFKSKDEIRQFGIFNCMHIFCSDCLLKSIVENFPCPNCRNEFGENDYLFFHKGSGDLYFSTEDEDVNEFYHTTRLLMDPEEDGEATPEQIQNVRNFFDTFVSEYTIAEDYDDDDDNMLEDDPMLADLQVQNETLMREVSEKNAEIRDLHSRLLSLEQQLQDKSSEHEDSILKLIDKEYENKKLKMENDILKEKLKRCNKRKSK